VNTSVPAIFDPAFYVMVEGYSQTDIARGYTQNLPNPFPGHMQISLSTEFATIPIPEDRTLPPNALQRFTFPFKMTFLDDIMFSTTGAVNAMLNTNFSAAGSQVSSS
jgi:hypothetical protein